MSQTLDILFNLLEKKWTDNHLIVGTTGSALVGLLLPFWGAFLKSIQWFKDYKKASKERKEEMIKEAKKAEMKILKEEIAKGLSEGLSSLLGQVKKDESDTPTTT